MYSIERYGLNKKSIHQTTRKRKLKQNIKRCVPKGFNWRFHENQRAKPSLNSGNIYYSCAELIGQVTRQQWLASVRKVATVNVSAQQRRWREAWVRRKQLRLVYCAVFVFTPQMRSRRLKQLLYWTLEGSDSRSTIREQKRSNEQQEVKDATARQQRTHSQKGSEF